MKNLVFALLFGFFMVGCSGENGENIDHSPTDVSDNEDTFETTPELSAKNWYVRLVATDHTRGYETRSAVLGELEDAERASAQALTRIEPEFSGYIDIVFKNPADLPDGEYKTHFKQHVEGETKTWSFTVLCDDPSATVTLKWRGFYVLTSHYDDEGALRYNEHISRSNPLLLKMQLVDEQTGRSMPVVRHGQIGMMSFNMDGSTSRTFRWELLASEAVEVVVDKETTSASSSMQRAPGRSMNQSIKASSKTIDFSQPPAFKGR